MRLLLLVPKRSDESETKVPVMVSVPPQVLVAFRCRVPVPFFVRLAVSAMKQLSWAMLLTTSMTGVVPERVMVFAELMFRVSAPVVSPNFPVVQWREYPEGNDGD